MTPVSSAVPASAERKAPAPELDPAVVPNLDDIEMEDHAPVENIFVEKQYRLLTNPLYSSWQPPDGGCPFLALTNVGLFHTYRQPPLVPDAMLALDAAVGEDLHRKENHSYFMWLQGKPPEVVVEIVSDRCGGEEDRKLSQYARIGVLFYVIFDPNNLLGRGVLRTYVLERRKYTPVESNWFPEVGLGLRLWEGTFEGCPSTWLRWCDRDGRVIPTGAERAEDLRRQAEAKHRRADEAEERTRQLEARLRALGAEPQAPPQRRKRGRGRS